MGGPVGGEKSLPQRPGVKRGETIRESQKKKKRGKKRELATDDRHPGHDWGGGRETETEKKAAGIQESIPELENIEFKMGVCLYDSHKKTEKDGFRIQRRKGKRERGLPIRGREEKKKEKP